MAWNNSGTLFFLTNGVGCIHVFSFPAMVSLQTIIAHTGTCICIKFDPRGRYGYAVRQAV